MNAKCSICEADISVIDTVEIAEVISCNECKSKLEVIGKNIKEKTVDVKEAPKVEEDWGE